MVPLMKFQSPGAQSCIPYQIDHYLQLVDWTGRVIRNDKRGSMDCDLPPIMDRLGIDAEAWRLAMRPRGNVFGRALGRLDHLRLHANTLGQSWVRGLRQAQVLYSA
jgi:hypothetical protein